MKAVLISTYDMGRQPFGVASAAAWLHRAGCDVSCVDLAKEPLPETTAASADLVGLYLPMHTATRLAAPVIAKLRQLNRSARICAFGLYAPLNESWLRSLGVEAVFGGEFEADLARFATNSSASPLAAAPPGASCGRRIPRLQFLVPDRSTLPPLTQYATLQQADGSRRAVGYTEASRGCKHLCRHCPIVPIYGGQFRIVDPAVVAGDVDAQVRAGARHITFGDPDFFNGPKHAMRVVERLRAVHPDVTYDVTIKIEHLLKHRGLLPRLAATGCAFVTTAVESIDDAVLVILQKGHTRADFIRAVDLCRDAGLTLAPTFVAFHPWLTLRGYCDLLDTIEELDLVDEVAPIQLAIRLLLPAGSRLVTVEAMSRHLEEFDPETLMYRWTHPDPRVDALHGEVTALVGARLKADRRVVFDEISRLAHDRAGVSRRASRPWRSRASVPYLNEPWYC